jgi:Sulfotransferase family
MHGIHAVDTEAPEEEFALLEDSFAAWTYTLRYYVPEYARWLAGGAGSGFAYGVHHRAMQHLSWQRGTRLGVGAREWLLKMPFHLAELEILAQTYPDAVFIQTHREPREFMGSWCSLAESVRSLAALPPDGAALTALGAEQLTFMSHMLERTAQLRTDRPEHDHRFVDVSYRDLVENPVRVAEEIYRQFGWTFDDQTRTATERWHAGQAARRQAQRRHRYSPSAYGLTGNQVDEAFSRYAEFTRANKIRMR